MVVAPPSSSPPPLDECLISPGLAPVPGRVLYLGLVDYGAAWRLQLQLLDAVLHDRAPDLLLLCQHPDVITVGRRQRARDNILHARFPTFEVERGGDATYHGPGQLVGYPILKLRPNPPATPSPSERDLHRYLRALEGGLIDLCAACGIDAGRSPGATGVWTRAHPARKLASMGIAVRRWITFHGFALNVTTDLSRFSAINPCGFSADVMASLQSQGGHLPGAPDRDVTVEDLLPAAATFIGARLNRQFMQTDPAWLTDLLGIDALSGLNN